MDSSSRKILTGRTGKVQPNYYQSKTTFSRNKVKKNQKKKEQIVTKNKTGYLLKRSGTHCIPHNSYYSVSHSIYIVDIDIPTYYQ
jgi:hypothetical protein